MLQNIELKKSVRLIDEFYIIIIITLMSDCE